MREELFLEIMQLLIRSQTVVSLRTIASTEKSYFAVVPIGVGKRNGQISGAFVDIVQRFEKHADKESIAYVPAFCIREVSICSDTSNYPLHWIRIVEKELSECFTLKTVFPQMFERPKTVQPQLVQKNGLNFSRGGKRILKPKSLA